MKRSLHLKVRTFLAVGCAALLSAHGLSAETASLADATVDRIQLEGDYAGHLQDVWWDGGTNLWWAHTLQILRTDRGGKILASADVEGHNAGCEVRDGRLYVAVCPLQVKTGGNSEGDSPRKLTEIHQWGRTSELPGVITLKIVVLALSRSYNLWYNMRRKEGVLYGLTQENNRRGSSFYRN